MNHVTTNDELASQQLGGVVFNPLTRDKAMEVLLNASKARNSFWVVTSNLDHMLHTLENREFAEAIAKSQMIVADGWPLVAGLRLMGHSNAERIAGSDLLPSIAKRCAATGQSIFIMGGLEGWAEEAAERLVQDNQRLKVAGCYFPPFGFEKSEEETNKMIHAVNATTPDFLFIGVGSPKQEIWIANNFKKLQCGVVIGVGAAIGFTAKKITRAPVIMQKTGLEWFFRFCTEPKRLGKRYAKDSLLLPGLFLEAAMYRLRRPNKS